MKKNSKLLQKDRLWNQVLKNNTIPTGKFKRASIAGTTAVKIGAKHLSHLSKRPFLSKKEFDKQKQAIQSSNAQNVFKALSHLRGTALKIAQILSMDNMLIPEKYQEELSKSYHQVPPLNRALTRKIIRHELGQTPEKLFITFDNNAFAAASLGQVHHASNEFDQHLVIKIQYPGIRNTIQTDIQLISKLIRQYSNYAVVSNILSEVEERLLEETDYLIEAENTQWFLENLQMSKVITPSIHKNLCTKNLLCMDYINGLHLEQWLLTNPSQKLRDHFAQIIYDLYIHSVFVLHRFHADPNPGNYLFREDKKLGLIDFGCIKKLTPSFSKNLSTLFKVIQHNNTKSLFETYNQLGMINSNITNSNAQAYYDEAIIPIGKWFSLPFKETTFDFSKNIGYASKGFELYNNITKHAAFKDKELELNKDFIFTHRTLYGIYSLFEKMGARVKMQNHWIN